MTAAARLCREITHDYHATNTWTLLGGGFGDVAKATDAFFELEIEPLQSVFLELNGRLGAEAVKFRERARASA